MNIKTLSNQPPEWLSLDTHVSDGSDNSELLYVRARKDSASAVGIFSGDLVVINKSRKPQPKDIVLISNEKGFFFSCFSDVSFYRFPLQLAAKNGETIQFKARNYEIIGVATYICRRLERVILTENISVEISNFDLIRTWFICIAGRLKLWDSI